MEIFRNIAKMLRGESPLERKRRLSGQLPEVPFLDNVGTDNMDYDPKDDNHGDIDTFQPDVPDIGPDNSDTSDN